MDKWEYKVLCAREGTQGRKIQTNARKEVWQMHTKELTAPLFHA